MIFVGLIQMSKETVYRSPGFLSLLGLVFIILKLCNVIDWSWWWILAPFWIPVVFALFLVILVLIICYFSKTMRELIIKSSK